MKRILSLFLLAAGAPLAWTLGCEGEPPVVPANPPGASAAVASAPIAEATAEETATAAATACPPPPCTPAPASSAAASASAAPAASGQAAAAAAAPPAVQRGNITGDVTTMPAAMKSLAVVYLEDGPVEDQPAHRKTVTIANKQMNFIPYVSVAAAGSRVVFTNEDPFPHNVFSPDNEKFSMGSIPQNAARVRTFEKPGEYSLLCNLHPGMLGYLVVTPSAWFARVDRQGHYLIKNVPDGTYKLTAWAPRQALLTQSVTVGSGDVTVNFSLHR